MEYVKSAILIMLTKISKKDGKMMDEVGKRCVLFIDQLWKYFYFCLLAGFSLTDLMILFLNELSCKYTDR